MLLRRTLTLLKIQVGPDYDSWKLGPLAIKNDMWETLQVEFKIPSNRREDVLKDMNQQFKTWKRNLRRKYFKGLGAAGIRALKDKVPENEKIRLHHWNAFVEHEVSDEKLVEREVKKQVRSKKTDVHCLGRKSYAEKADEMKQKDPAHRSPNRTEVYFEARNQPKTGLPHPNTFDTIHKIKDLMSDQSSNTSLDNDPLTQALGRDTRGTVRGVGPISKGKYKATEPLKSEIGRYFHKHDTLENEIYGIKGQLSTISEQLANMHKFQVPQFSPSPHYSTPESSPSVATPSPSISPQPNRDVKLVDMSHREIASARTVHVPKGAVVHHAKCLTTRAKLKLYVWRMESWTRQFILVHKDQLQRWRM